MTNFIYGRNAVLNSLKNGKRIHRILISKSFQHDNKINDLISLAHYNRVPIVYADKKEIEKISSTDSHQGVLAYVPPYQFVEVEDILDLAEEKNEQPFILMLDEIEDPYNFGSLIRTSVAAGVHGIIVPAKKQAELSPTVVKVSTGAVDNILIAKTSNLVNCVQKLKDKGLWIIGTHQMAKESYLEIDYKIPLVLIIGNEGKGMSRLLTENCDYLIKIPMATDVIDSLNASVAGALVIFKIMEKRKFSK
ncbi:MAG: 23S rRNA (guanosine(2251)-2'-O)-methyltransferase RlmB [Candidatus Margulisbacteria bacterium]|nr:23S rRNA (guanosine(2251)-2'-O)-methyltransferase RlmB [Candidatus Margulisiibacteriota bacterium]